MRKNPLIEKQKSAPAQSAIPVKKARSTLFFIVGVSIVLGITALIELLVGFILMRTKIFVVGPENQLFWIFIIFVVTSVSIGVFVSVIVSRFVLSPVDRLLDAMQKLSKGDYGVRVDLGSSNPVVKSVSENFNRLAEELQNTELLRSDFSNNFSHEFKTPIVSVYGFAKLLNKGGLDEKTEKEYLKIIEEESARLANMATKVLNMTKIENTAILTNKTRFDLSEDIRTTFLLLEKKWTEKNLTPVLDFDEVFCWGDRDLLKEAWLNLTENAIKFANPGTELTVKIERDAHSVKVSFTDVGAVIPRDEIPRIFGKFYQADKSHKTQGNGIGLSMVKKITELHFGKVDVISDLSATTFTVTLRQ